MDDDEPHIQKGDGAAANRYNNDDVIIEQDEHQEET